MSGPNSAPEQGQQDYRTPAEFIARVQRQFNLQHFNWDLACSTDNSWGIDGGYTLDTGCDALAQDWTELAGLGDDWTCWLNPPFGISGQFAAKCATSGARIVALVPVAIGTQWWKRYVHNIAHVVGVGRLVFDKPDGSGPVLSWNKAQNRWQPSAINRDCAVLAYNMLPKTAPYYLLDDWKTW